MQRMDGTTWRLVCATAGLALALGCGERSSEERLAEANEAVAAAEAAVEEARLVVEREERDAAEAETELAEAREGLSEAELALAEAQARVAEVADDAYLFRAVQTALLGDEALEDYAIAARVSERVVRLEGSVPEQALRERAAKLAAAVAGVERVDNRVVVAAPAAPPPPPPSS